jgi:PAT family beta-lactamase induction signal transducer AmpG
MTSPRETPADPGARAGFLETLEVYLQPRVLIVLFLGFSAGLPLALSGSTLRFWMRQSGVDLGTIGLLALVGTPYTVKFLWAPLVDALDVPVLSRLLGRRRGWLILTQILLIVAIVLLAMCNPATGPWLAACAGLLVATASATQDIVIDAFRVESLPEREQAAGMASYVFAYRIGALISTAGLLYLVDGLKALDFSLPTAWTWAYLLAAALILIGIVTTVLATEPQKSAIAAADHAAHAGGNPFARVFWAAIRAFTDFFQTHGIGTAVVVLAFVVLFKFTDALAGIMTESFVLDLGFSGTEYASIVKVVGLIATLVGGFAGGFVARAFPLATSLWIGGVLQAVANFTFSLQALAGHDIAMLTLAITTENFTSAIGTVIFVAYLSALCRNPLHTATQYALLTALAAVGRTYLSAGAGFVATATGWAWFFAICAAAGIPSLILLWWLQKRSHFRAVRRPYP